MYKAVVLRRGPCRGYVRAARRATRRWSCSDFPGQGAGISTRRAGSGLDAAASGAGADGARVNSEVFADPGE